MLLEIKIKILVDWRGSDGVIVAVYFADIDANQQGVGGTERASEGRQGAECRRGSNSELKDFILGEETQGQNRDLSGGGSCLLRSITLFDTRF